MKSLSQLARSVRAGCMVAARAFPGGSRGFTLMELMVILAIAGMLLAMAAPSVSTMVRIYGLRGAARQVYAELQNARMAAVKENRSWSFAVASTRTYKVLADLNDDGVISDPAEIVLSREIDFERVTISGNPVVFRSRGTAASAATFSVTDEQGTVISISVSPAGAIRIDN